MRDGWTETTLGDLLTLEYGRALKAEDRDGEGFPVFGSAGEVGLHSEPTVPFSPVIVVGRKGTAGAVHWSDSSCSVIDTAYFVRLRTSESARFMFHLLVSADLPSLSAQTGVPGLNRDRAYGVSVVLPPLEEQKRIVDVVSSVDVYIDALKDKVVMARVARNAVLHELLNAGGPDWTETTLGDAASLTIGRTPPRNNSEYWSDSLHFPFCSIADMDGRNVIPGREGVSKKAIAEGKAKLVKRGTLLMSFKLTLGRVGFAGVDLFPNEAIVAIEPRSEDLLSGFLYLYLGAQDFSDQSGRAAKGATMNSQSLSQIHLLSPPFEEQRRIVEIISSMDEVIEASEKAVTEAVRLRSGLLSDLLSGEHEIPSSYDALLGAA